MGKKILKGEYLQNANKAAQDMLDNGFSEQQISDFTRDYVERFGVEEEEKKNNSSNLESSNTSSPSPEPEPVKNNLPTATEVAMQSVTNAPKQRPVVKPIENDLPTASEVAVQSIKIAGRKLYEDKQDVVLRYPIHKAEQEAFDAYKSTALIPESVKKGIGDDQAKKIISSYIKGVTDPSLEVSPGKAEEILFKLTKKQRDEAIGTMPTKEIMAYNEIGSIVAGNDHLNSRLGKVAKYISDIKNGDQLSPEDYQYFQKAAPTAWAEITQNGQIPAENLPEYYADINSFEKVKKNNLISKTAIDLSSKIGFDTERYNDNAYLSQIQNSFKEQQELMIKELDKKYQVTKESYGPSKVGGGVGGYRNEKVGPHKYSTEYNEEKREIENEYANYRDIIATASTQLWASENPNATAVEIGKHYLSIMDPDKLKLFELSGGERKTEGEIAEQGYRFMYATANPQVVKKAQQAEKQHADKYPDEKITEIYHRIGSELFKKNDNILIHAAPTVEDMDQIANTQLSSKDREIYLKHIRPAEESRLFGTNVPRSGFLNKAMEAFGTSIEETWKGGQDLFGVRGTQEQAKEGLAGIPTGKQDVGEYERGKARLEELKNKPNLTFDEIQERRDLERFVDVRNYWAKGSDLIGNTTGQVVEMALGGKGIGMLGKAAALAKTAKAVNTAEKIGMGFMSHAMSYDQARRDLLQLKPQATEAELTIYGNIIGFANAFSEQIFHDPKVLQAFAREVSPAAQRIFENLSKDGIQSLTSSQFRSKMENFIKRDLVKFAKEYGKNVGQEVIEEEVVQVATSILDGVIRPDKFSAKAEWDKVVATAAQTAIGMTLIGGVGAIRDVRANRVTTQLMNRVGYDNQLAQEVKNVINSEHALGNISDNEKNEKLKVVNTLESIHATTIKAANEIRPLSKVENEKIAMLTLQERMLNEKIDQLPYGDTKDILQKQVNDLKAKRNQIIQKEVVVDDDYNLITVDEWNRNNITQAGDIAGGVINNYLQNKKDPATESKIVTDYDGTVVNSKGEFTKFGMELKNRIASGEIGPDDVKIITARHEKDAQMIADKLGIDVNNITAVGGTDIEKAEGIPAAKKAAYERLARYYNLSPLIDNDKANVDATGGILYQDEKAAEKDTITPAEIMQQRQEIEPAPVIPVRNNDFVNKFFTDEEKAQYNQLDPDSDEAKAMVKAKRKVVAQEMLNTDAVKDGEAEVSNQTPSGSAPSQEYEYKGVKTSISTNVNEKDGIIKATFTGTRSDKPNAKITTAGYRYGGNGVKETLSDFEKDYGVSLDEIISGVNGADIEQITVLEERAEVNPRQGVGTGQSVTVKVIAENQIYDIDIPVNKRKFTVQKQKPQKGRKQIEAALQSLKEAKTPLEKLNSIHNFERNENLSGAATTEEKDLVALEKKNLSEEGYDIVDLVGKNFNPTYKLIVQSSIPDDNMEEGKEIITKVFIPQVNKDDKMVQVAHVEVTVGTKKADKPKTSNDYADYLLDLIEGKQNELGWKDVDQLRAGLVDEFIKTTGERDESRAIANLESLYVQYLPKEERVGAYQTIRENFKNKDNATPESKNQQQEGNKPSGDGQHQGTVQGQQKPQQEGVGQQGQAQKPTANNSNSGSGSKKEEVDLTKVQYAEPIHSDNEIVFVDPAMILDRLAKDDPNFDVQNPSNQIGDRVNKAKKFIQNYAKDNRWINPKTGDRMENTKATFEPSVARINDGKISFEDGRHRILAAKELGAKQVAVEVPKDQVELFKKEFNKQENQPVDNQSKEANGVDDAYVFGLFNKMFEYYQEGRDNNPDWGIDDGYRYAAKKILKEGISQDVADFLQQEIQYMGHGFAESLEKFRTYPSAKKLVDGINLILSNPENPPVVIGKNYVLNQLDAEYEVERLVPADEMYKRGYRYSLSVSYPYSLGEMGNSSDEESLYKEVPTKKEVEEDVRKLIYSEIDRLKEESNLSARDEKILESLNKIDDRKQSGDVPINVEKTADELLKSLNDGRKGKDIFEYSVSLVRGNKNEYYILHATNQKGDEYFNLLDKNGKHFEGSSVNWGVGSLIRQEINELEKAKTPEKAWTITKDGKVVEGVIGSKGKEVTNIIVDGIAYTRTNSEVFSKKEDAEKYLAETPIDEPDERLSKSIRELHEKGYASDSSKEPLREVMRHFFNNGEMAFKPIADYLTKLVDDRSPEFIEVLKGVYLGESLDYDNLDNKKTINSYEPAADKPAEPETENAKVASKTKKVRTSSSRKSTPNDEGEKSEKRESPIEQVKKLDFFAVRHLEALVYSSMIPIKYNRGVLYEIFGSGGKANKLQARRMPGRGKRFFGKKISEEIHDRSAFMNQPLPGQKKFETVDQIVHYVTESLNSALKDDVLPFDEGEIKTYVINAISESETPTQLAQLIIDRFKKDTEEEIENEIRKWQEDMIPIGIDPITGEWLPGFEAEREKWEKHEGIAIDAIAELTDAEFEEMMKGQDEFRQWEIEYENRKVIIGNATKKLEDAQLTDEQVVNLSAKDQFRYSQIENRANEIKKLIDCLNG